MKFSQFICGAIIPALVVANGASVIAELADYAAWVESLAKAVDSFIYIPGKPSSVKSVQNLLIRIDLATQAAGNATHEISKSTPLTVPESFNLLNAPVVNLVVKYKGPVEGLIATKPVLDQAGSTKAAKTSVAAFEKATIGLIREVVGKVPSDRRLRANTLFMPIVKNVTALLEAYK